MPQTQTHVSEPVRRATEGAVESAAAPGKPRPVREEGLMEIRRVSKRFDGVLAVDDVSLSIRRGEIFALLGGSGSGKSTLLRMLAGFEKPSEGQIVLDGEDITTMPPYERPINMMFQSYALFPHMTVAQNIAFGLKQDRLPRREIEERVAEMLKLVHMEAYARRKPHQLSGGQRQRVALARSLAKRPKLLLLDEPSFGLAPLIVEEIFNILRSINKDSGVSMLLVEQNASLALELADYAYLLETGRVVMSGPADEIMRDDSVRASYLGY